jgi:hypothetical protein
LDSLLFNGSRLLPLLELSEESKEEGFVVVNTKPMPGAVGAVIAVCDGVITVPVVWSVTCPVATSVVIVSPVVGS